MKRTNTKRAKWKGRPGETYDLLVASSRPLGARVNVHRWTDTNDVEVRAIRGDGRTPEFQEFSNETLRNPTPEQLAEAEHRALQALAKAREVGWDKAALTLPQILAKVPEAPAPHYPHAHMKGPVVVVIYSDDMAEKIVGPFSDGFNADVWLANRPPLADNEPGPEPWADVFPLDDPLGPCAPWTVLPPEPPGDDPIPCGDCGHVHGPDDDCPEEAT